MDEGNLVAQRKAPDVKPDQGFAGSPRVTERVQRAQTKARREASRMDVLRPPTPATKGKRAFTDSGDLGWSTSKRRADVVDRLGGVTRAEAVGLTRQGPVNITSGSIRRPRAGVHRVAVNIPSVHADGLEQLVGRIASDPRTAPLADRIKYRAVARLLPGEAPKRFSAAVVRDGITRSSSVQLQIETTDATVLEALGEILLGAEQGSGAAIRNAAEAADLAIISVRQKVSGYRSAFMTAEVRKGRTITRLSRKKVDGATNSQVLITSRRYELLTD